MNLHCYLCDRIFSNLSDANKHLKKVHFVMEHVDEIFCLTSSKNSKNKCVKSYRTFRAMNIHVKNCLTNQFEICCSIQEVKN